MNLWVLSYKVYPYVDKNIGLIQNLYFYAENIEDIYRYIQTDDSLTNQLSWFFTDRYKTAEFYLTKDNTIRMKESRLQNFNSSDILIKKDEVKEYLKTRFQEILDAFRKFFNLPNDPDLTIKILNPIKCKYIFDFE